MDEIQKENIVIGCLFDLIAKLPKVTGNMVSKTAAYITHGTKIGEFAKITIQVPYAQFVNYGFENHPHSKKLGRDYMIVEHTLRNSLRARIGIIGGIVK